jgi:hypothetical protein
LSEFGGRFVALRLGSDEVGADAATFDELVEGVRERNITDVSIMGASREDEPVHVGFG